VTTFNVAPQTGTLVFVGARGVCNVRTMAIDDRIQIGKISVRPEVGEELRRIAREEDRTVVTVARRALAEWVAQYQRDREPEATDRAA
jgi:hypothetical protein